MSIIKEKKVKAFNNSKFMVEHFKSADEIVKVSKTRKITNPSFTDYSLESNIDKSWTGVSSYEEALELMRTGYQPAVEGLKAGIKTNLGNQAKRITFKNDVVGFNPVVPLVLQGVPNCMVNSYRKPIKTKVIDVYYNMEASWSVSKEDITKAGANLLSAILELEMQGYKFNIYAVQAYYSNSKGCDMLCVKVKNSNTPLDLKKISFPLTHTAFFRVIGFDWYSRTPKGTYRGGYGTPMGHIFSDKQMQEGFKELFGNNAIGFDCQKIINDSPEHIKKVLKGER